MITCRGGSTIFDKYKWPTHYFTIFSTFPPSPPLSMLFLECEPDLESPTTLILGEGGPCSQYELKN